MEKKTFIGSLAGLILVLVLFESTPLDLWIQDHFYNPSVRDWFFSAGKLGWAHRIFYIGIKQVIIAFAIALIGVLAYSVIKKRYLDYRAPIALILLTLVIIPLAAMGGKEVTNVHCPYKLTRYDGSTDIPYRRIFDAYPPGTPRGYCFPGGHASGGFALMSIFLLGKRRRTRIFLFCMGLSTGWLMASYQMLRGMHFLSHQLTTMLLTLIFISGTLWLCRVKWPSLFRLH